MSDLGATTWTEVDANNNATPPNGWPEGMNPSDVNNAARAEMGGEKRFWVRTNSVFTTAGTTTAYTLTYGQAAAAYYDGEEFSIIINATCGTAPTLNINGLGARNLRKFVVGLYMTLIAGDLVANQQLRVRYNLAATSLDIISGGPTAWTQLPSAAGNIDFTLIPTTINNLAIEYELLSATNASNLALQVYGTGGVLDTGTNYAYANNASNSGATGAMAGAVGASAIVINYNGTTISNNASVGISGRIAFQNIQAARYSKCGYTAAYLDSGSSTLIQNVGGGWHAVAANITGFRLTLGVTVSGRVTVVGT